ncbi:MAG TPA: AAA family ATPase [Candidatus Cybelea sp.]|nr:AAA family ATPase [Candidatus Cybelea sp.]
MKLKTVGSEVRSALIGRRRESDVLTACRRDAGEGRGQIVLLGGEAGVGKSCLLRHFESTIRSGRPTFATARCVEFVQTPLGPLRDLLQQLDRRNSTPRDSAAHALVERLTFERNAEATGSSPHVGALFEAIDGAFERYARRGTVILLVEDIHWADRSTLGFLAYLADRIERRRLLLVATYRSDELRPDSPRLVQFASLLAKKSVTDIDLAPLDEPSVRVLIDQTLPHGEGLSSATVAGIVRRSQGNPFFAEELLKSELTRDPRARARELPLSIRGAILARAGLLSQEERTVLSFAAVLGERFSVDRLVALCKGEREPVLRALEHARALQLVEDESGSSKDLAFRHALTQEVLYGELLAERVRPLHQRIAEELERRSDRAAPSVELAHHWRRAGDLRRGAMYDEMAADHAHAMGAFADAVFYYERALGDRQNGKEELVHKIGVSLGSLNQLNAGIERLRHAGELYWRADDFEGFAKNASALGAQLYNSGDTGAATAVYHQAIEAVRLKLPPERLDLFRARIAYNCVAALDDEAARSFLSEIREPIADPMTATQTYLARLKISAMHGDIDEWRLYAERAIEAARPLEDTGYSRLRHAHCQIALDAVGLGEVELAREHFQTAMPLQPELHSSSALVSAASALEHTLRGDFMTAASLLRDTAATPQQSYAILVHVKSANFVLGICCGDDARLTRDDSESFLRYGVDHGMRLAIGLLGGPYAWALGIRGEADEAAAWIARIADVLPGAHRFLFAYLAAAQFGRNDAVRSMRSRLVTAAARPQDRVNKAVLALFDAFAAQRGLIDADPQSNARTAAGLFEAIGWSWLAARAYELAGESKRALETYRRLGAVRDLRRLEVTRSDATLTVLSAREQEVAQLVAAGHPNEEIAQLLHISSRTAEKHVSSALKKLNLRSRLQLGRLLARSQALSE